MAVPSRRHLLLAGVTLAASLLAHRGPDDPSQDVLDLHNRGSAH